MTDLFLHNARVLTMEPSLPRAEAVAVRDGRIAAVGDVPSVERALGSRAERIDCRGGTLLPAFIDAHCHLIAHAARLLAADCTGARSIAGVQAVIREAAARTPPGRWVRAHGYEDTALVEKRHPDRRELDAAAPAHPVRLVHRSGHASVLNSVALDIAGIDAETEEPPGGSIERDVSTGEPTGVLFDMEQALEGVTPPLGYDDLARAVAETSQRLLRQGIVAINDATHTNGADAWELVERLMEDGALPLDVALMEGVEHMGTFPQSRGGRLRRGAVKIMLHELGDEISPDEHELTDLVARVHDAGRQVAVHAIGVRAVRAAADAIASALGRAPREDHRHRIEHCSMLPEGMAARLAALGVVVVSQPSFITERGARYLELVPEDQHDRLYAFRALLDAGVTLAASSDAPVAEPQPLVSLAAAIDRRTQGGQLAPGQSVSTMEALRWWTAGAASAAFFEGERGSIRSGLRADLVLVDADLERCPPDELRELKPSRLWLEGRPVDLTT